MWDTPLVTLSNNNRFEFNAKAMDLLGLTEGDRVDFAKTTEGTLIVHKELDAKLGRSLSKLGKAIHAGIWSVLAQPAGEDSQWAVNEETVQYDGTAWNVMEVFTKEVVVAVDAAVEETPVPVVTETPLPANTSDADASPEGELPEYDDENDTLTTEESPNATIAVDTADAREDIPAVESEEQY